MAVKKGIFYGVGIGPGDPELLTLKAVRVIKQCAVIATPETKGGQTLALDIAKKVVPMEGKTIEKLYFTMERSQNSRTTAHLEAVDRLQRYLDAGQDVAMLNLGDVSIYATYSYLMEEMQRRGYQTEMIAGVPSFCAVAATLGVSLTEMNTPLHIVPSAGGRLEEVLALPGSKVLMKSGKQLPKVIETIKQAGLGKQTAMIENCGLETQQIYRNIEEVTDAVGYFATIVIKE